MMNLDADILGDIDVDLTVVLGTSSVSLSRLMALQGGGELELDTPLDSAVNVVLNGRVVARGEVAATADRFAVRITEVFLDKKL